MLDRSHSMTHTIKLAREALKLFLYSLPAGSKFNVCSFGSVHRFLFNGRSVEYNDKNLEKAIRRVSNFEATYGGTKIYEPLKEIFDMGLPTDCDVSHIYLLTDGAIWDTQKLVNLVAKNCNT